MIKVVDKKIESKEQASEATRILTDAFYMDAVFRGMLMYEKYPKRFEQNLYDFMHICVDYYVKAGKVLLAYNEGKMVGVCLFTPPGGRLMTTAAVLKKGMLIQFAKLFIRMPFSIAKMIFSVSDALEANHYKPKHSYIFEIGSLLPGAGTALVEEVLRQYPDAPLYLENSNENNQRFYNKFQLVEFGYIYCKGIKFIKMLRKG